MLAELRMELETDYEEFGYYQSSNLQGVLMQQIDEAYADVLHRQGAKPYSQCVLGGARREWVVRTLTKEAYERLMLPLLNSAFADFVIEKKNIAVRIVKKELRTTAYRELLEEFYTEPGEKYLNLEFLTPTAFKSGGAYVILPEVRLIYQSLMNRYSAMSGGMEMYDEETLTDLAERSSIAAYRLKSTGFPMEGVRIPSFKGEIRIKTGGNDTMARYARLLARFGEFAGVGIKTAVGMGSMRIGERRRSHDGD